MLDSKTPFILVFDLDDTLFAEIDHVKSGFRSVAAKLAREFGESEVALYRLMLKELKDHGRGKIFDRALESIGKLSKGNVLRCIWTYRTHLPELSLFGSAERCLQRFRGYPLFLVTDGNKIMQSRKVQGLALERRFRRIFITHRFGLQHAKPSPYCFLKVSQITGASPTRIVYVGDNAQKDFVGIKPLGFRTVRVLTGPHAMSKPKKSHEAECVIRSLDSLKIDMLEELVAS